MPDFIPLYDVATSPELIGYYVTPNPLPTNTQLENRPGNRTFLWRDYYLDINPDDTWERQAHDRDLPDGRAARRIRESSYPKTLAPVRHSPLKDVRVFASQITPVVDRTVVRRLPTISQVVYSVTERPNNPRNVPLRYGLFTFPESTSLSSKVKTGDLMELVIGGTSYVVIARDVSDTFFSFVPLLTGKRYVGALDIQGNPMTAEGAAVILRGMNDIEIMRLYGGNPPADISVGTIVRFRKIESTFAADLDGTPGDFTPAPYDLWTHYWWEPGNYHSAGNPDNGRYESSVNWLQRDWRIYDLLEPGTVRQENALRNFFRTRDDIVIPAGKKPGVFNPKTRILPLLSTLVGVKPPAQLVTPGLNIQPYIEVSDYYKSTRNKDGNSAYLFTGSTARRYIDTLTFGGTILQGPILASAKMEVENSYYRVGEPFELVRRKDSNQFDLYFTGSTTASSTRVLESGDTFNITIVGTYDVGDVTVEVRYAPYYIQLTNNPDIVRDTPQMTGLPLAFEGAPRKNFQLFSGTTLPHTFQNPIRLTPVESGTNYSIQIVGGNTQGFTLNPLNAATTFLRYAGGNAETKPVLQIRGTSTRGTVVNTTFLEAVVDLNAQRVTNAPDVPTDLVARTVPGFANTVIEVSWGISPFISSPIVPIWYELEWEQFNTSTATWEAVAKTTSISDTIYRVTGLMENILYRFRVRARGASSDWSAYTAWVERGTVATQTPTPDEALMHRPLTPVLAEGETTHDSTTLIIEVASINDPNYRIDDATRRPSIAEVEWRPINAVSWLDATRVNINDLDRVAGRGVEAWEFPVSLIAGVSFLPEQRYEFRARVENAIGKSEYSEAVEVTFRKDEKAVPIRH